MRIFSLAFLLGILLLQHFSSLPDKKWLYLILPISLIAGFSRHLRLFCACGLGFAWCLWYAHAQLSWTIPDKIEGKTIAITGQITSIPDTTPHRTAFLFAIKKYQTENTTHPAHGFLRLSWQEPLQALHVGDEWQLNVRLKKIHGTLNPGGFDYEAWAVQEGIVANGYVVNKGKQQLLSSHWYHHPLDRAREYLKEKIAANLPVSKTSQWIPAFVIGLRNGISQEDWEVLRNTGTNHLMAIAGLHIGFMSGFAFMLAAWLWRRIPRLTLRFPAQHAGAIAALSMALTYSALAGFSIPTQRACIMLSVFLWVLLLRRKIAAWHAWSAAMLVVLLLNPLSVLTESFWLSFGAVAFIIYGVSGRLAPTGLWWKWGRIQWVIAVGLIPFSIWLFQQCSIVSFPANSIAIPCVGILIVPLCLLGSFCLLFSAKLGGLLLMLADKILGVLWIVLTWFSQMTWASWYQVLPNYWILLAACVGIILLLLPIGFPGRYLGFIWLLPLFFYQPAAPKPGEVWLTLLDVGQGLSAVIQTQKHIVVFDTGPKLSPNFDMGESVVVPFLRSLGVKTVDMLIVSHGDNDHIGGAAAIMHRLNVKTIKTSVPDKLPSVRTSYCLQGQRWQWDQVEFEFLYPANNTLNLNNDSSCVLRVSLGDKHILLTGDIEKFAENFLINDLHADVSTTILIAPHHGSKTSAEDAFVQAVHPEWVLFPIGYRNRYHFPHASVIAKYDLLGARKADTSSAGAIHFKVDGEKLSAPLLYRLVHHRYWHAC